jgi:superfamily II RNA helicase
MRDLLSRGIGVHHGGLLPLVKEVRRRLDPFRILTNRFPGS